MAKKQFKAESKRLLDLMINSIYPHKEIFLRELISNASDAIDKLYYKSLADGATGLNRDDFQIFLAADKDSRTLRIRDNGIGMTQEELGKLLGVKKAAINKYETGTVVNLKRSTIENLCNIFSVTPQFLLSDADLSHPSSSVDMIYITGDEKKLIETFRSSNKSQQARLLAYLDGLLDARETAKGDANSSSED